MSIDDPMLFAGLREDSGADGSLQLEGDASSCNILCWRTFGDRDVLRTGIEDDSGQLLRRQEL